MQTYTDILIIGAGVVGCAAARALSLRTKADILVVERAGDVAEGASKANSGIVHAGFDAHPGSEKARLNVLGARMYPALCAELQVPFRACGALVVAFDEADRATVENLLAQGQANGVPGLRIVEREELLRMEPNLNPAAVCALEAPTSAIVSPYELVFALADHAALNGTEFRFDTEVLGLTQTESGWLAHTAEGDIACRCVLNCAGIDSARLHNQVSGDKRHLTARRGQYDVLDHPETPPFSRTIFQCPTKMGKGVLVTPTVHGNVLLGPTAEDIPDGLDVATTAEGLADVFAKAKLTWPGVSLRTAVTNFSGIRAHEDRGDFLVGRTAPHCWEAVGVESPGLTSAPAIAEELAAAILADEAFPAKPREETAAPYRRAKPFNEMTAEEQAEAVRNDPLNGQLICRCEVVTEAEIRAAIRRPVGARTVDGVKRRCRAGMGRCQGGFCAPRVVDILAEELGLPRTAITKGSGESRMLVGEI
ncbi:MAG: NAD(P)/FAD-dependent oxidoreductase [Clostridia bacterium]|nr:NAD(P)/FAD-dependent oxidoreductase [Clostridia bacterium]